MSWNFGPQLWSSFPSSCTARFAVKAAKQLSEVTKMMQQHPEARALLEKIVICSDKISTRIQKREPTHFSIEIKVQRTQQTMFMCGTVINISCMWPTVCWTLGLNLLSVLRFSLSVFVSLFISVLSSLSSCPRMPSSEHDFSTK